MRRLIKRTSNTYSPSRRTSLNALTRAVASVLAIASTGQVIHKDAGTRAWDEYPQEAHLDPTKRGSLFSCSPQDIMTTLTSWEIQHTDKSGLRRFMDFLDPLFKGLARFALASIGNGIPTHRYTAGIYRIYRQEMVRFQLSRYAVGTV